MTDAPQHTCNVRQQLHDEPISLQKHLLAVRLTLLPILAPGLHCACACPLQAVSFVEDASLGCKTGCSTQVPSQTHFQATSQQHNSLGQHLQY